MVQLATAAVPLPSSAHGHSGPAERQGGAAASEMPGGPGALTAGGAGRKGGTRLLQAAGPGGGRHTIPWVPSQALSLCPQVTPQRAGPSSHALHPRKATQGQATTS